jgi:imidazolonepropionase-like amidohydrolase
VHALPLATVLDFARHGGDLRLCDGVDECIRAVREQLRRNAKVIKVCASGGVLSEVDDPIHQQFTAAELRAIVEVAGMADRVVAAHCHGKPGIMAAVEAGVRTIEHGTYLDEESCDALRETGTFLVATRRSSRALGEPAHPAFGSSPSPRSATGTPLPSAGARAGGSDGAGHRHPAQWK